MGEPFTRPDGSVFTAPASTPLPHTFYTETSATATSTTSVSSIHPTPTNTGNPNDDPGDGPDNGHHMPVRTLVSVIMVVGVLLLAALGMWYCYRKGQRKRILAENSRIGDNFRSEGSLPLHNIRSPPPVHQAAGVGGEEPPPMYAEVIQPGHQRIAGGITNVREEEEGIISDGKMPLSEIAFEDVVLERSRSGGSGSSSSNPGNGFQNHHGMGGDTSGHTNS